MKKFVYLLLSFFIYLFVPIVALLLITSRTSLLFGVRSFTVMSGSMEPVLPVASMVFAKPDQQYATGDIITFKRGDTTITHRIIQINSNSFQVKGDANKEPDSQVVHKADIIGKNFLTIPYIGRLTTFLKTIPGFILFLAIPTFVFIGFELANIKKEIEKNVEEKVKKQFQQQHTI